MIHRSGCECNKAGSAENATGYTHKDQKQNSDILENYQIYEPNTCTKKSRKEVHSPEQPTTVRQKKIMNVGSPIVQPGKKLGFFIVDCDYYYDDSYMGRC
jgi:hypothetical protein